MASSLNSKRVFLVILAVFGLLSAIVSGILLATGVREPTRERLFLVGSLVVVSVVCIVLAFVFKGQAEGLDAQLRETAEERKRREAEDPDEVALPQNATASAGRSAVSDPDPDDVSLPQNAR